MITLSPSPTNDWDKVVLSTCSRWWENSGIMMSKGWGVNADHETGLISLKQVKQENFVT